MINKRINGKTDVFAVIGEPIEHTSSPVIQNTFADKLGKNMIYTAFHVFPENLEEAVKGAYALGIKGLNVTVPHKKAVMEHIFSVDDKALQIGAVNTLKYTENGYVGYNTDILGIDYTLKEAGFDIESKNVLLLGAGGAACAAGVFAASKKCSSLIIANRTMENAQKLKEQINKYYDVNIIAVDISQINSVDKCEFVFNATTLGFGDKKDISPIKDVNFFNEKGVEFVFDAIYNPWQTPLLKMASESKVKAVNGFSMLVYQAIGALEIWYDEKIASEIKIQLKSELSDYYSK